MTGPGRNDPCPCGSGLKHKKCCLAEAPRAPGFSAEERESALGNLGAFADDPRWSEDRLEAAERFWGPYRTADRRLDDETTRIMSRQAFDFWFFFDDRRGDGRRLVETLLDGHPSLTPGERRYLEQAAHTCVKLYDIVEVRPGSSLTLRDPLSGQEVRVRERLGSRSLHRWDVLAARIMPVGASGQPEIDGTAFPLPRLERRSLLADLERRLEESRRESPGGDVLEFHKANAPALHQAWLRGAETLVLHQALTGFDPDRSREPEIDPNAAAAAADGLYEQYYRRWLDDKIPALDDRTPREAARDAARRPRLVELLKDLENQYERALELRLPGFDPWWMWDELALGDAPEAPGRPAHPPPTGHEAIERLIAGIGDAAREIAGRFRRRPGFGVSSTITREELAADPTVLRFLGDQARAARRSGAEARVAVAQANLIGSHLEYLSNFELHHRKTFWVDDPLAWMLGRTQPSLTGDLLRLPFACFALVFCDRFTLGIAERMLSADSDCALRGRILRIATVYVTEVPAGSARGVRLAFTFDALAGQWPYLVVRDLHVEPQASLDAILESHFPEVDVAALDPLFSGSSLRRLVELAINAILYATSAGVEPELRRPPSGVRSRRRTAAGGPIFSSDEVFFLPGKIDISHVRQLQRVERAPGGGRLMHRFMVRGHWRRAPSRWHDQRPRWIEPYWKGPDIAAVIERAYRLKP